MRSALALLLVACGAPSSTESAAIGPAGGSLVAGRLALTVPPGALATAVRVTAAEDATPPPTPSGKRLVGIAYDLAPPSTTFATPARLTLAYAAGEVAPAEAASLTIDRVDGTAWVEVPGATASPDTLSVAVDVTTLGTYALFAPGP